MTDRRRINGPLNGTTPPVFTSSLENKPKPGPVRTRKPDELRKLFLKTSFAPSASGSAYLEIERPTKSPKSQTLSSPASSLKLSCAIHGPKPLPRSANFSTSLQISTYVKFAPFAALQRRGYIRDSRERDLSVHLETALKGVIIGDRWPKAGLDIIVTVLEGEDEGFGNPVVGEGGMPGLEMMNVLAGCITVASAALSDARIDCLDLISGGVAAIVEGNESEEKDGKKAMAGSRGRQRLVLDPCPSEHGSISAACVVGYLATSDEITELWLKGDIPYVSTNGDDAPVDLEQLMGGAVECAAMTRTVLVEAVTETAELLVEQLTGKPVKAAFKKRTVDDDHDRMEE